jgi:hypothetical protein
MFSPRVIERREAQLHDALKSAIPGGRLRRLPPSLCWAFRDQLANAVDAKGNLTRELTSAEQTVIQHERLLATIDFRYWAERWAIVAKEAQDAAALFPLWKSQSLFLAHLAHVEEEHFATHHPDGILVNVLKARQLGISTISEVIMAHGLATMRAIRGIVAADVEEQSKFMLSMAEMVIDNLPWWLKPELVAPTLRNKAITTASGCSLTAFWGKSSRGGLADREKAKGNLGRGKTFARGHLSELSTWERPEQIDDGLMPGVPRRPKTLLVFESTAKGRYDWWHKHWDQADRSVGRFHNIFIPWYIEPDKYWLPVPEGWVPSATSKQHAEEVERDSPRWTLGPTIRLTPEQLYWYEATRRTYDDESQGAEFTADGRRVATFYEEYPASPRDAFQHAGQSIFNEKALERMRTYERPPVAVCEILPAKDIAMLKAWERDQEKRQAAQADS